MLAFVPARGGSRRLPGKALRQLGGRSLISWTIEAAVDSGLFDRVVVSSDAEPILEEAARFADVEVRRRPDELASDTATTMDALGDFLTGQARHPRYTGADLAPDIDDESVVCLLQPTTPFRRPDDIVATVDRLAGADAAISVVDAPAPLELSFELSEQQICIIPAESPLLAGTTRSQAFRPRVVPNGAVYASTAGWLREHRSFFAGRVAAHVMPRERSIDIDDEHDWRIAQCLAAELR